MHLSMVSTDRMPMLEHVNQRVGTLEARREYQSLQIGDPSDKQVSRPDPRHELNTHGAGKEGGKAES